MALDIKFGLYVNLGTFKSIMNRYEKKLSVQPYNLRTVLAKLRLWHNHFLTASFKIRVVLTLQKIDAYITCLKYETKQEHDQKPKYYVFVKYWRVKNLVSLKCNVCMEPSSEYKYQYWTAVRKVKFFVIWYRVKPISYVLKTCY
jgi:hypothetical protein